MATAVRWNREGDRREGGRSERLASAGLVAIIIGGAAFRNGPTRPSSDAVVAAGSPGALVLVDDRSSRREAASGLAVLRGHVPLDVRDRFRVGSITKTFVAVIVLQLVNEHLLRLGDTVERWLPGVVPGGSRITVRELLAYRSGLANYASDASFLRRTVAEPRRRWTPRQLVRVALAEGPVARPGKRFAYASTNYVLLGLVVERATGTSLERQLRGRILAPLGLKGTSFVPGRRIPGGYAHGYAPTEHDGIVGSLATARDRSKVSASMGLGRRRDRLRRSRSLPFPWFFCRAACFHLLGLMRPARGTRCGLGLAAFRTPCGTAIGPTGALLGIVSAAWGSSDGRRRVVAMSNSFPLSPSADAAPRRLLDASFVELRSSRQGVLGRGVRRSRRAHPLPLPLLRHWLAARPTERRVHR